LVRYRALRAFRASDYPDTFAREALEGGSPMPWRISYQHPLRADDGGIRFVPDQSEAAAEKLRLELRGYAVSTPTQAAALRLIAQTETDEAAEAPLVRV
jgi:hypothetical protein